MQSPASSTYVLYNRIGIVVRDVSVIGALPYYQSMEPTVTLRQRSQHQLRLDNAEDLATLAHQLTVISGCLVRSDSTPLLPLLTQTRALLDQLEAAVQAQQAQQRNARALSRALAQGKEPSRKASRRRSDH